MCVHLHACVRVSVLVCGDQEARAQLQVNGTHRRHLCMCDYNVTCILQCVTVDHSDVMLCVLYSGVTVDHSDVRMF
jgi:hypothetical protein